MHRKPLPELWDRNVFVTGAASGIGRAVAERCARAGAHVHLTDIDAAALEAVASDLRSRGG